jgi:hypothetical protein
VIILGRKLRRVCPEQVVHPVPLWTGRRDEVGAAETVEGILGPLDVDAVERGHRSAAEIRPWMQPEHAEDFGDFCWEPTE